MKRIQLFEFEDLPWFPSLLRRCMTNYLITLHSFLPTEEHVVELLIPLLLNNPEPTVIDLCSGSGGVIEEVVSTLRKEVNLTGLSTTLTDLYPNPDVAERINRQSSFIHYRTEPTNAARVDPELIGVRTIICGLHHLPPETARHVLFDAQEANQPFLAYEISNNPAPRLLWWVPIPFTALSVFFLTLWIRPLTWQQLLFTYLIPVLPVLIAWDGAVSNARTYTADDLKELLEGMESEKYSWSIGELPGRGGKKIYIRGVPA